jgi:hypothetical protein
MQFTYEREGNDCWPLTDTLYFIKDSVYHTKKWTGYWAGNKQDFTEVKDLLKYLDSNNLTLDNFPKLEDYLKENYPEALLSTQPPTERELITQLIKMVDQCMKGDLELVDWNMYKQAKLYLDPNYDESDDY